MILRKMDDLRTYKFFILKKFNSMEEDLNKKVEDIKRIKKHQG